MSEDDQRYCRRGPCATCPFSRDVEPGRTGGSDATVFIGQIQGPFLLPCHATRGYYKDRRSVTLPQCGGAAVFRSNVGVADRMPASIHRLPADTTKVFGTAAEFLAWHRKISLDEAVALLTVLPPDALMVIELGKSGVQVVESSRPEKEST